MTGRLEIECSGEGWWRGLTLAHDGSGTWTCESEAEGDAGLPAPGADAEVLTGALDCDLGFSPLTNTMPIRRHGLHEDEGGRDFLMAWVSVPDLAVHAYAQRYEHLRRGPDGAAVRFLDKGLSDGFVADLELDPDGFVSVYPELARRVS